MAIYTGIREAFQRLTRRDGHPASIAITLIAQNRDLNPLGYSWNYVRDVIYRIDIAQRHRKKEKAV